MITYILRSSCFCEISALCVSWITYDHLYIYIYIYGILIGFSSVSESNSELHCGEYFVILLVTLLTIKSAVASAAF